jgi:protoheme IX farnesyltransferase
MIRSKFAKFSWGLLYYNLAVILWGAFVRASLSGDGCGNNWPNCGGTGSIIPVFAQAKTVIEFTHRMSVALLPILLIIQIVWCFIAFGKGSPLRKSALVTGLFIVIEALIGAVLVKKGLVGADASVQRAVVMTAHLLSTFVLLASLGLTAAWSSGIKTPSLKGQGAVGWVLLFGFIGVAVLGVSGAVAALGDTLFKAKSLADAFHQDFSPTAHFLLRLRPYHPLLGISVGVYTVLMGGMIAHFRPSEEVKRYAKVLTVIFLSQIIVGFVNLALLAPIWMQLIHLLVADMLWVTLVLMAASAFAADAPQLETERVPAEPLPPLERSLSTTLKAYITLTKPKVISLLLFTTITAMFAAKQGWPGFTLLICVAIGGYMSAGAANTINMVIDRDIDGNMKRTAKRPTVTQYISSRDALLFGFGLEVGSFAILWSVANLLTAVLALAGLAFYVVVYTLILKRRTWHNIVIGGAAGSFPPLVGWAAITNQISPLAWLLFAIIFVWTPVHFWALALMIKEDYANAGVPMLPVVHGERATAIQILLYAVLTVVISMMPFLQPHVGWAYLAVAVFLNVVLMARCVQLYLKTERPQAVILYKYSMLYLAVLFLAFAIDRVHVG